MKRFFSVLAASSLALGLATGCANKTAPLPTNAINATDAGLNANLQFAHAFLAKYQQDVVAGLHVPTADEKTVMNKTINSLNFADTLYCGAPAVGQTCAQGSYHALLLLNPSAGEPQQLIDALAAVTANLNALQALIGQVK